MLKFLASIGLLAILAGIGTAVFFFGGYYSVATTAQEPQIVQWALVAVRTASISRHATDAPPAALDNPSMLRAGARAFSEHGCTSCHGGPGVEWAKFSEGLRPDPPDLKEVVDERRPAELFWVIKNGINMTGMPGFGELPEVDIWSIVAFLKKLPTVSDEDFKTWSAPPSGAPSL
jgi:mono/diheme cytochrome c family protein